MLGHLDVVMILLRFLPLTAFPLGGEFRCVYENNRNRRQPFSFTEVEPARCCDTSGSGTQLFQLIFHGSGDISGDLEELVRL